MVEEVSDICIPCQNLSRLISLPTNIKYHCFKQSCVIIESVIEDRIIQWMIHCLPYSRSEKSLTFYTNQKFSGHINSTHEFLNTSQVHIKISKFSWRFHSQQLIDRRHACPRVFKMNPFSRRSGIKIVPFFLTQPKFYTTFPKLSDKKHPV